ncbi:hypothetical protein ACFUOZ_15455 [Paenarthrobacter sp. NPDC057355]|uniref:hypothetical protein n=1 Tax=Paenarthrobacter sp. NPDC057355 TaxID=3346105 RepID=UPI00362C85D3
MHGPGNAPAHRKPHCNVDGDRFANRGTDGGANRYAYGDLDGGAHRYAYGDLDGGAHVDGGANRGADVNPLSDTGANSHANSNLGTNINGDPHPNSYPQQRKSGCIGPGSLGWRTDVLVEIPWSRQTEQPEPVPGIGLVWET